MPRPRPQLAKLTKPRLHNAVARERLFAKLDEARRCPAICVVGPPGAGKTTLVASWLDAGGIKGIWYQVDPGDADLPTFFYYLGEAVKPFGLKGLRPLPLLTPEYLQDVPGFSRRFFRELFSRLPQGAALVLDNYQEVEASQRFHELVAAAIDEVPQGVSLVAISRRDPPDCYARLIANENVAFVGWDDLKLTINETGELVSRRGISRQELIALLHEQSGGWVAGLVLLFERLRHGGSISDVSVPDSLRDVFGYFAGQLFERATPEMQDFLLQVSFLPRMTADDAQALTNCSSSSRLLEDLHRRHFFTERRTGPYPVYQFHALFRAFLQHRAEQTFIQQQQIEIVRHAAGILESSGNVEDAFPLYLRAGDMPAAAATILRCASELIGQGRWRVVVEWIDTLPKELVEQSCWLLQWYGTAKTPVDPKGARVALEASYEAAIRQTDLMCQIQAAAGVIETHVFEYANFRAMDRWIEALKAHLEQVTVFENAEAELRARSALLISLSYRKPDDPALNACTDGVFELVQSAGNVNLRTLSAAYLVAYGTRTGPLEVARKARPLLEQLLGHPEVTPMSLGMGWFMISFFELVAGDEQKCRVAISEVARIGRDEGLPAVSRFAAIIGAHVEFSVGNVVAARRWSDRLEETTISGPPYNTAIADLIKAWIAMLEGDPASAYTFCKQAVERFDEAGTHFLRCNSRFQLAWSLILLRDFAGAERSISEAQKLAHTARSLWMEAWGHFSKAFLALEQGDRSSAAESLRLAFGLVRNSGCDWPVRFLRLWAPHLCSEALRLGIEVKYVRDLIRRLELPAPSSHEGEWPWPVKVYALGRFEVFKDDVPLRFGRKAPKRPLAVMKALIAFGGHNVPLDRLVDALWEEDEGDSAQDACWLALHRLRKLLGTPEAIQLADSKVSLNPDLVWVDVAVFERALPVQESSTDTGQLEAALALYHGDFLAEETSSPWAVSTRERLRAKYVHHLEALGHRLEEAGREDEAINWYLRGLDADALAETFYQGLMRCYQEQGRIAEAMSTYRRLRQILSVTLGTPPSAATEAMARVLRAGP